MPDINNQNAKIPQQNINSQVFNQYGEKKIKKFLGSPFFSEIFLGREDELKNIHQQLMGEENLLLLVNGEGGIGKTTLASQYYITYQDYYQHLAWVFTENSLVDAMLTLATPLEISFPETMPAAERLPLLLDEMRNLNKACLLVIDNANNLEDLESHYNALRSCPNFHLLLTSRITEFQQARTYKIEGLAEEDALELFKKYYPKYSPAEDAIFKQVRIAVGGNTLALELLAKNLQQLNRLKTNYTLAELLADLQKKGLLALSKSQTVGTGYHAKGALRKEKPAAVIEAMYDLGELDEPEKCMLSVFAVLPAENIAFNVLECLLKDTPDFSETLLALAQKGWLNYNETDNAFKISPLIQEITLQKNPHVFSDCDMLIYNLVEKLLYQSGTGHFINASYKEAALYAHYGQSIVNSLTEVDNNLSLLHDRLGNYYRTTGNLVKARNFYETYNILKEELLKASPGDVNSKNNLAVSFSKLGETHTSLGNTQKALNYFKEYNRLEKEIAEAYPDNADFKNGLAISYQNLGKTHATLGNLQKALEYFNAYNSISKELCIAVPGNVEFKNSLGISYQYLGTTHTNLGNLQKALEFYTSYYTIEKELHEALPGNVSYKNNLAISCQYLGTTYSNLDNQQKALEFYTSYNTLEKELYEDYPDNVEFKNGLAISYQNLGNTQENLGNFQQALEYYDLFNKLEKELYQDWPDNVEFKNNLAISYQKTGKVQAILNAQQTALECYLSFNRLEKELYESYPDNVDFKNGLAISYQYLGNTHGELDNLPDAINYFELFNRLEKELSQDWPDNVEFKNTLAISYIKLGWVNRKNDDKSIEKDYYQKSKDLLLQLVHDFPDVAESKKILDWVNLKLAEA